jgi:uncharacterized membrane protein
MSETNPGAAAAEAPPPRPRHSGLTARLRGYFLAGVLVKPLIPARYNPEYYLPFSIPGLGLIVLLVGLTMVGMLAAGLIGRTLLKIGEGIVQRMPIVRGIYSASKQVIETVVGHNATSFREVVLVEFPRRDCWTVGFITGVAKGEIGRLTDEELVSVFVPTTPNPTGGYVFFVPRREVIPLQMSVEDGLKLVVSMGIVVPPEPAALPAKRRIA